MKKLLVLGIAISLMAGLAHAGTRIGAINAAAGTGFPAMATIGMDFNDMMAGDVGLAVAQDAGGNNTNIGIAGRLEWKIAKVGNVQTYAAGYLKFASDPNYTGGDSSFCLGGLAGIAYPITKNLEVIADIAIIEIASSAGTTTFSLLSGAAGGSGVGAVTPQIYSGARLYI